MATKSIAWNTGSGNINVEYGGNKDGTIVVTSDNNNLYESRSQQITVRTTDGSNIERTITIQQAAKVRIDISTAVVTASNQTYNGSAKTPTPTVTLNGVTIPSTGYDVVYSNNTNAGTATITVTGKNDYTGTATGTFTIAKANPVYVAPTANNRTYDTSSAALLVAGSNTTPGSFTYSTSQSGTYSTTIPSQTNAGTYTTWWKFTPTDTTNYNSIGATSVSTTISAKTVSSPTITLSQSTYTYSGSACTPTATVKDGSTTISSSEYTVSYSNNTNACTATVTITDKSGGNYTVSGSTTFTINKANPTYTAPTAITGLTYSGSSQYLVTAGSTSHGTIQYSSNGTTWSTTRPSSTNAGSYTTYWRLVGDSNHNDVASTSLSTTIAKASRTLSFADSYVVLNTSSNVTKTATPSAGSGDGTITYSISSTTYATINSSSGKVTSKTSDGSAVVTATIAEGTNYLSATASYNLYVFATTHNYDYNGSYRSVTLPPGTYQFQCWGAQGGSNGTNSSYGITAQAGGKGGYSVGQLTISQATGVRVYVGGQGSSSSGGFNGGGSTSGSSTYNSGDTYGTSRMGGGGGATDIRLSDGSLYSRMIVAGGGSGGAMCYKYVNTSSTITDVSVSGNQRIIVENYYYHVCIGVGCVNSNFSSWKSGSDALFVVPFDKSTLPVSSTWETRDVPFYFRFMPVSYFSRIIKVIGLSYYVTAPMPKWNDVTSQNQTFTITNMAEQLIGITFTITKEAQAVYFVKQNGTTSGQPLRIQVRESISGGGEITKYLTPANPNNSWQESSPQYVGSGTREETVTLYGTFYMGNIPVGGYAEYHLWADSTNTGDMREAGYFSIRKIQY